MHFGYVGLALFTLTMMTDERLFWVILILDCIQTLKAKGDPVRGRCKKNVKKNYFNGRLGKKHKNVSFYGVCMYVRPKLTFVSFFMFFLHPSLCAYAHQSA